MPIHHSGRVTFLAILVVLPAVCAQNPPVITYMANAEGGNFPGAR
jgi:hypothetical protein